MTQANLDEVVHVSWHEGELDQISIRSGWEQRAELPELLRRVVVEVNAGRGEPADVFVPLRIGELDLEWNDLVALLPVLRRYNDQLEADRLNRVETPAERVTDSGRVSGRWLGGSLMSISVDPNWVAKVSTQTFCDALTAGLGPHVQATPQPSDALLTTKNELEGFLS